MKPRIFWSSYEQMWVCLSRTHVWLAGIGHSPEQAFEFWRCSVELSEGQGV